VQRQRYGPRFRPEGGPQAAAQTLPDLLERMRTSPQTPVSLRAAGTLSQMAGDVVMDVAQGEMRRLAGGG
jgi:hypothetical protein